MRQQTSNQIRVSLVKFSPSLITLVVRQPFVGEQTNMSVRKSHCRDVRKSHCRDVCKSHSNIQINPPRSRSCSSMCVSKIQVISNKHVGPKKESLHNKRKVTFKQDESHVLPRQAGYYSQQTNLRR